jgi:hypothetical protein
MGSMAVVSNAAGSLSSVTSMTSAIGLGVGSLFVSVTLIYLLAYFNIVDAADIKFGPIRRFVGAVIVPLSFVFAGIVLFQALEII